MAKPSCRGMVGHRIAEGDPANFKDCAGHYQLAQGTVFTVTLEDDRLYVQLTGQPRLEVFPESERDFFYKVVDAQITFEIDGTGPAPALILHQGGQNLRAPRISEPEPAEPNRGRTKVTLT